MKRIVLLISLVLVNSSLPIRHGTTTHRSPNAHNDNRCPICLKSSFFGGKIVTDKSSPFACYHPNCRYHKHCLTRWIQQCKIENKPISCPLCRAGLHQSIPNIAAPNFFYIPDENLMTVSIVSIGIIGTLVALAQVITVVSAV